ncbi:superoxide dismutase [Cu-Zn] SodC [Massilia sp. TS11]|uniref:superoxide dismutase [Cu-Zn] SodC n=1 Tax=Massilia sp. TS11 TaxID=2908003 RepID=UPI001EDA5592|nr:superoxide dismutase [Cu-Zn] SodC [Massilia sp. TS11]MCG2584851.1 superoxide dismutase [Cu-Zn] SodC [Massilia sp. TS11]
MTRTALIAALSLAALTAHAAELSVNMNIVNEAGVVKAAGTVLVSENAHGLVFTPNLSGLPAGLHGFHVHENPSCDAADKDGKKTAALGAGGHLDPAASKKHGLPWGDGHLGDLPALYVDANGNASQPVLAPRLKLADLKGRSLMIHAGGDNHADHPAMLGGGGARIVCGVF